MKTSLTKPASSDSKARLLARTKFMSKRWAVPICILIASLLATQHGQTSDTLIYARQAILDGEWYRLLTFHFVHLSTNHFLINLFTLAALWLLYGRTMRMREWIGATIGSGFAIGLCLLLFSPEVQWSAGLSGLLYALFACAAIRSAMSGEYLSVAVVVFLVGKVVMEQTIGPSAAMEQFVGSSIVVDAHMFGVVAGLLSGVLLKETAGPAKSMTRRASRLADDSAPFGSR
jgi:rhomboid family GlyGly-CTERM serine protease